MSRPATRSKNKRHKLEAAEDYSSEILRKIHVAGEVTEDDLRQLYLVSKPVCEGCRVNSKESPNCFCGLVPASNGTRKSGLWQKLSEIVGSLGPNPCRDLRSSTDTPAGLTNLGATCYANSILQCLYMNTAFRTGIFSVEPDLLHHQPVLDQLSRLFAQLHSSNMAFIDSAPFIKTLELDNGVQQDSHEFLTLFLSLLERSLRHSKASKSRNMVQDLYRGTVSHVTRCSVCGRDSESSSKMEDFYELELNINGLNSLYDSLDDYLSVEELQGENQYFCEPCGKRVNATRCIKLRALPAVLNLQLKRYVFLPKTTTRKKITSMFSFPGQLNMGPILSNIGDSTLMYDLSAILIHKGTAVNSGHYVAHIKDVNTGQWWEFDDEHVSKLGCHPFGEKYLKQSSKSDQNVQMQCADSAKSISNGIHTNVAEQSNMDNKVLKFENIFSSSDAYMLMYCRMNAKESSNVSCNPSCGTDAIVDASLPLHLGEEIQKLNSSYAKACEDYQLEKDKRVACITERRQEVKSILSEAPVRSLEDPFFWISADWLRQWADSVIPPPLDNCTIQCMHGKAPASKVQSMKRISNTAWQKLLSKYEGGPPLTEKDYCIECIREEAKNAISATDYRDRRTSFRQIAEAAIVGNFPDENLYYVSRAWLIQWLRRKNSDTPCDADAGPTASLRCPHGDLVPELTAAAKRVLVPESLWLFLYESANIVKPDDVFGCFAFPSDSESCIICSKELSEVACLEDDLRAVKHKQRQNHEKLSLGKGFDLYPGHKYFLVPSSWLAKWRAYVSTTGKNISSIDEPESLDVSIDSLRCEKHSRLLERPLELVCKRGIITQRVSSAYGLALVTENDWKFFCEEWNVREEKGIQAEIIYLNSISEVVDLCGESPILEIDGPSSINGSNNDLEDKRPFVKTHPEICQDCIGERESSELMRKLNYSNEDICVYLVSGKDPPKSLLQPSGIVCKLDRRTSKRSRKTSFGNFVNLSVSCLTSIYQLKMMIWESFGVVKENQKLHKGAVEIEGDSATLADKNIFPGDVLWVTDTGIFENRDIAEEISGGTELQEFDGGFRGSLLTSDASVQEWQDRGE